MVHDLRLGITLTDERQASRGRPDDGVDLVILRTTLLNLPRVAGARRLAERLEAAHPGATRGLYAWHYVTHASEDALPGRGTRTLATAGDPVGHLRSGDAALQAWSATDAAREALGASHVVLRTPPSFAPGSLSRRRLSDFVARVAPVQLVWEPEGMWGIDESVALAAELGMAAVVPAFDSPGRLTPLDPTAELHAWRRIGGMGARPELSSAAAEILAFELGDRPGGPTTLVFEGERAHANLRRLRRALQA